MMPIRNRRRRGFLSTPSARRATGTVDDADFLKVFLSTPSARRATKFKEFLEQPKEISIHALREEGDRCSCSHASQTSNFYPRPPRGGRPRGLGG